MPLRIFRSRPIVAANAIQMLSVAGMFGMFFLGALYLRRVLGYDALKIGLAFLPATIGMGTLSIGYSDKIFMALGPRRTLFAGLTLILAGLALFAIAPVHANYLPTGGSLAAAARRRGGHRLPGADERRDDRRHPAGRGAGLRSREHDRSDRRCARARHPGHALDLAQQQPQSQRRPDRLGARPRATTWRSGSRPRSWAARWSWW